MESDDQMMVRTCDLHLLAKDGLNTKVVFVALLRDVDPQDPYFFRERGREVVDPSLGRDGTT